MIPRKPGGQHELIGITDSCLSLLLCGIEGNEVSFGPDSSQGHICHDWSHLILCWTGGMIDNKGLVSVNPLGTILIEL